MPYFTNPLLCLFDTFVLRDRKKTLDNGMRVKAAQRTGEMRENSFVPMFKGEVVKLQCYVSPRDGVPSLSPPLQSGMQNEYNINVCCSLIFM